VLVPDLAGWRRSRLGALPETAAFTLAPDWICEVISPSTEGIDRGKKLAIHARERVSHAWLINPTSQTLEGFVLANDRGTLTATHVGAVSVRADPFAEVQLALFLLWPSP
jgi:Uma2 family endonuclease